MHIIHWARCFFGPWLPTEIISISSLFLLALCKCAAVLMFNQADAPCRSHTGDWKQCSCNLTVQHSVEILRQQIEMNDNGFYSEKRKRNQIQCLRYVNKTTVGDNRFFSLFFGREWGNLPTTKSFAFVKCIYFFINYMSIIQINWILTLEPLSLKMKNLLGSAK